LFDYIGGILRAERGFLVVAGGASDHVHLLAALSRSTSVSEALRTIKAKSSRWIHETYPDKQHFAWQAGYGAFAVSYSSLDSVKQYIAGQAEHHKVKSFQDEFIGFLRRHKIEFDERNMWN
jgi:REP element-mobilizing transposase RayT